jgi:prepilin-type N-terminal cleavage/methylation domain-containing protein/prepilin-type processing-associated H-X9-DG protein
MLKTRRQSAFTLIEVMVVVAIIALLLAILLPGLKRARGAAYSTKCLSNLRQMATAAFNYTYSYDSRFPPYQYKHPTKDITYNWDFTYKNTNSDDPVVTSGLLWTDKTNEKIQQCPAFNGESNAENDPYTGYNYNTSYVGFCIYEQALDWSSMPPKKLGRLNIKENPVKLEQIKRPGRCALFGDGEVVLEGKRGANKFMRAPSTSEPTKPRDKGTIGNGRSAGTQGYRHLQRTNVAWADGHATSERDCFTERDNDNQHEIGSGTGFLSKDNSLYDLE